MADAAAENRYLYLASTGFEHWHLQLGWLLLLLDWAHSLHDPRPEKGVLGVVLFKSRLMPWLVLQRDIVHIAWQMTT
jgi:hypothetical protein